MRGNWSRYLTPAAADRSLGLVCLGAGGQSGSPPGPRDRVLSTWAAVLATSGGGWLSTTGPAEDFRAPVLLWLAPGVRHSYQGGPGGWTNQWVLFDGPAAARYTALGYLDPARPLHRLNDPEPTVRACARVAACLRDDAAAHPHVEAAAGLHQAIVTAARDRAGAGASPVTATLRRNAGRPWPIRRHAQAVGLSERALRRHLRAQAGCGPHEFIQLARLDKAKALLVDTDLPVAAVARRCGFADPAYFSRAFSRHVGMHPTAFRGQRP